MAPLNAKSLNDRRQELGLQQEQERVRTLRARRRFATLLIPAGLIVALVIPESHPFVLGVVLINAGAGLLREPS